jgi:hypothetical protein
MKEIIERQFLKLKDVNDFIRQHNLDSTRIINIQRVEMMYYSLFYFCN